MTEEKVLSNNDLTMHILCENLQSFKDQKEKARLGLVNSTIAIDNFNELLANTIFEIKELERKGIKKVVPKKDEKTDRPGSKETPQAHA